MRLEVRIPKAANLAKSNLAACLALTALNLSICWR